MSKHNVSPIECDQVVGTSTNQHTTKWAGAEATAVVTAAPEPSEPPPPAGAAATAATRYKGNTGGTSEHEGRAGQVVGSR